MEKTSVRKEYPSQLNTKSIACRVPISDYVSFLEDANKRGINLNDWLLTKIYGNRSEIRGTEISEEYEKLKEDSDNFNTLIDEDRIMQFPCSIGPELDFKNCSEFIKWLFNYIDTNNKREERIASIEDVKNQLTILINEKFSNIRDRREYRSELLPLLKELE